MAQMNNVSEVLNAFRRRVGLITFILVVGFLASIIFALSMPKLYQATAVVQIETPQISIIPGPGSASTDAANSDNRLALIEQKVMARDHLEALIAEFALFADFPDMSMAEKVAILRQGTKIQELIAPADRLRPGVQPSGLIITVRLGYAQQAADVANRLLENVLEEGRARRSGRSSRTLAFFEAEEARVNGGISQLDGDIATFKQRHAESLPSGLGLQRDQLAILREAQLALEQQLIELETNRDRLRADELTRQSELLRQQSGLIGERIALVQTYIDAAPQVERELSQLERALGQLQDELRVITARRADAAMTQAIQSRDQFERFEVLETALVPEYPISVSRKKVAAAGGLLAIMVAFGIAFALEWTSPILRTSAQIEREFGLRPVISIPPLKTKWQRRRKYLAWVAAIVAAMTALIALLRGWLGRLANDARGFRRET
jgi:uncharacterized protein involved in exopolysaccharide biosynthesis